MTMHLHTRPNLFHSNKACNRIYQQLLTQPHISYLRMMAWHAALCLPGELRDISFNDCVFFFFILLFDRPFNLFLCDSFPTLRFASSQLNVLLSENSICNIIYHSTLNFCASSPWMVVTVFHATSWSVC